MTIVFADAGYWIALYNKKDQLHNKAKDLSKNYQPKLIVTSEMVLVEFLNHYASIDVKLRQDAVIVVKNLQQVATQTNRLDIIPQTSALFNKALILYSKMQDKQWGLVDCSSFIIMQEYKIVHAFAHDKHFRQAGFITLL